MAPKPCARCRRHLVATESDYGPIAYGRGHSPAFDVVDRRAQAPAEVGLDEN